jgi:hypothetical protein
MSMPLNLLFPSHAVVGLCLMGSVQSLVANTLSAYDPLDSKTLEAVLDCSDMLALRGFVESPQAKSSAVKMGAIQPMAFVAQDTSPVQYRYVKPPLAHGLTIHGFSSQFGLLLAPTLYIKEPLKEVRRVLSSRGLNFTCAAHGEPAGMGCEEKAGRDARDPKDGSPIQLKAVLYQDKSFIPTGETLMACVMGGNVR